VQDRAKYLTSNAPTLGVAARWGFDSLFAPQINPFHPSSEGYFQLELADHASAALTTSIANRVATLFADRQIHPPDDQETAAIVAKFLEGVPGEHTAGLGPILNAGWSSSKNDKFMPKSSNVERLKTINELVLKSVEVFEIERMTTRGFKKKHLKGGH